MPHLLPRCFVTLIVVCALVSVQNAQAHKTGITGVYQNGCGACHGGNANNNTQLQLTGNTTLKVGEQGAFTFKVSNANKTAAGCNLAILNGVGTKQADLQGGAGTQVLGDELTHTAPKGFGRVGGADFDFTWTAPAAHGTYTLYAAGNAVNESDTPEGDVWNTLTKTITVTGATITGPAAGQSYCVGETVSITWNQTGIATIKIEMSNDDFATITTVVGSVAASAGKYSYTFPAALTPSTSYAFRLVNTSNGDVLSKSLLFTVSSGPVVTTHPESQAVCLGRTLQLVAGASGKSPSYQWRLNGATIPGGNDPIYRVPNASLADAGSYDCVITACNKQVTTNAAVVEIQLPPTITEQTSGNKELCEGESLTLAVTATGNGLIYEWYKNGAIVPGAIGNSLGLTGVTLGSEGTYFCRVMGTCSPADTSIPVVVDVLEKPTITGEPSGATTKVGQKVILAVEATGDRLRYQWYKDGTAILGATGKTLEIASAVRADSGNYRCTIANNCDSAQSANAKLVVNPATGPGELALSTDTLLLARVGRCSGADTVVGALITNIGGADITVTSISVSDPSVIQVSGLVAPIVIQPGGTKDVHLIITPESGASINTTVTFFTSTGSKTLVIRGTVVTDMVMNTDTLVFATDIIDERKCAVSIPLPCAQASITSITVTGPGAVDFVIDPSVTLPLKVVKDQTFDLCVKTTSQGTADALATIASTAGTTSIVLSRKPTVNVAEDLEVTQLTIAPNPTDNDLYISLPPNAEAQVRVYSILGSLVTELKGTNTIRWDCSDTTGNRVLGGVYLLMIRVDGKETTRRVLVR